MTDILAHFAREVPTTGSQDKISTNGPAPKRDATPGNDSRAKSKDVLAPILNAALSINSRHISDLSQEIISDHRLRMRWLRAKNALVLQSKAFCRMYCSGSKTEGVKLFDLAMKAPEEAPAGVMIVLQPFLVAIADFSRRINEVEKRLKTAIIGNKRQTEHPLYAYVNSIKGFGSGNLAAIIGECGDIANYKNPSALWKRMGLAVIDGERQRKCADKEKAIRHGYNPQRRAVSFLLGESLLKAKSKNRYGAIYEEYKAKQLAQGAKLYLAHKRALRYMTKRALLDLWIEAKYRTARNAVNKGEKEISK